MNCWKILENTDVAKRARARQTDEKERDYRALQRKKLSAHASACTFQTILQVISAKTCILRD